MLHHVAPLSVDSHNSKWSTFLASSQQRMAARRIASGDLAVSPMADAVVKRLRLEKRNGQCARQRVQKDYLEETHEIRSWTRSILSSYPTEKFISHTDLGSQNHEQPEAQS